MLIINKIKKKNTLVPFLSLFFFLSLSVLRCCHPSLHPGCAIVIVSSTKAKADIYFLKVRTLLGLVPKNILLVGVVVKILKLILAPSGHLCASVFGCCGKHKEPQILSNILLKNIEKEEG